MQSRAHPASYIMGAGALFRLGWRSLGSKVKITWLYTSSPPDEFMVCRLIKYGDKFMLLWAIRYPFQ
jgi:hypothetical protein